MRIQVSAFDRLVDDGLAGVWGDVLGEAIERMRDDLLTSTV